MSCTIFELHYKSQSITERSSAKNHPIMPQYVKKLEIEYRNTWEKYFFRSLRCDTGCSCLGSEVGQFWLVLEWKSIRISSRKEINIYISLQGAVQGILNFMSKQLDTKIDPPMPSFCQISNSHCSILCLKIFTHVLGLYCDYPSHLLIFPIFLTFSSFLLGPGGSAD